MAFILKLVRHEGSPVASDNECQLVSDITSVSFRRLDNGHAQAQCWVREPIKTAEVPGYCEIEKTFVFDGLAYVMNESGKTVSTFTALTSGMLARNAT